MPAFASRDDLCIVSSAPRYDEFLLAAIRELDDLEQPIAETCRRVAARAEALGLTRPSYVHVRRIIHVERDRLEEERARRAALLAIAGDVYADIEVGRRVDAYLVAERVRDA